MKKIALPLILALACATPSLQAQTPRMGLAFNLLFPTGGFRNTDFPALAAIPQNRYESAQSEGYDVGLGAQFTLGWAVDPKVAIRLNLSGHSTDGSNTVRGLNVDGDYRRINLRHQIFSIGGDLQFFLDSATRHRGPYFLGGLSADFERFDRSFGDIDRYDSYDDTYWNHEVDTTRKSRMGGTAGFGYSFGLDAGVRFTMELAYHKTINGHDEAKGEPPAADFVKLSMGVVF